MAEEKKNTPVEELTDEEAGDLILQNKRISIKLTPENTEFYPNGAGLVSMKLKKENGETEVFERVIVMRCFPVSNADEFISVREPDTKEKGKGNEIGMIRHLSEFDEETQTLLKEELKKRYFTPVISAILSSKEQYGYYYWDVVTSAGTLSIVISNPFSSIRTLEDGTVLVFDSDGNAFKIPDPNKLDASSLHKIEVFL